MAMYAGEIVQDVRVRIWQQILVVRSQIQVVRRDEEDGSLFDGRSRVGGFYPLIKFDPGAQLL